MNTMQTDVVAIIGAGPVGIAAAAHLLNQGLQPIVLEKGQRAGHAMLEWGHVKVFTPWKYITDKAVVSLLEETGWKYPEKEYLPTAGEIVKEYLVPAATTTSLNDSIIYDAEVVSVSKLGMSKSSTHGREDAPYTIHYKKSDGRHLVLQATAVIDASGTWYTPNPIGTDGLPVAGEEENKDYISYGIPDVLGVEKETYKGMRTLVLGGGHSAINVTLDLLALRKTSPDTTVYWGLRRNNIERLLGGGINDELPARGALGLAAQQAVRDGALELLSPCSVIQIQKTGTGLWINANVDNQIVDFEVDRIVVAAGFRPNLHMLREIRLDIDDVVEAPTALAPLIDPNVHSCGTVSPHGVDELTHKDKNFFVVGMKAYGRAPTFLMLTGYEQVRSIAAELAGDHRAARNIELILPATGVCSSEPRPEATGEQPGQKVAVAASYSGPAENESVPADLTLSSGVSCCGSGSSMDEEAGATSSTSCCV
ncbi:MAG: NAD(P)-binding domain-containing protein [Rhodothermaceae bacterium]|nr:NAD(P)-binding domain-containing protein [Rhodothermaceae bacterium]